MYGRWEMNGSGRKKRSEEEREELFIAKGRMVWRAGFILRHVEIAFVCFGDIFRVQQCGLA